MEKSAAEKIHVLLCNAGDAEAPVSNYENLMLFPDEIHYEQCLVRRTHEEI